MQSTELPSYDAFYSKFRRLTLLRQNTMPMLTYWKVEWSQNKPFSNWNYQSHQLQEWRTMNGCKKRMKAATFELIQRPFALVLQWRCCSLFRSIARSDWFSQRQKYLYDKAWLFITKPGQQLCTQIYRHNLLSPHGGRGRTVEENSIGCC